MDYLEEWFYPLRKTMAVGRLTPSCSHMDKVLFWCSVRRFNRIFFSRFGCRFSRVHTSATLLYFRILIPIESTKRYIIIAFLASQLASFISLRNILFVRQNATISFRDQVYLQTYPFNDVKENSPQRSIVFTWANMHLFFLYHIYCPNLQDCTIHIRHI